MWKNHVTQIYIAFSQKEDIKIRTWHAVCCPGYM